MGVRFLPLALIEVNILSIELQESSELIMLLAKGISEGLGDDLEFLVLITPTNEPLTKMNLATDMESEALILCLKGLIDRLESLSDIEPVYVH